MSRAPSQLQIRLFFFSALVLAVLAPRSTALAWQGNEQNAANSDDRKGLEAAHLAISKYASEGAWAVVETKAREAIVLANRVYGAKSLQTANALDALAWSLNQQSRFAPAEATARKALTLRREIQGAATKEASKSAFVLAISLNGQTKFAEAESVCKQALSDHDKLIKEPNYLTIQLYSQLGRSLHRQRKTSASLEVYRALIPMQKAVAPQDLVALATSHQRVADALNSQSMQAKAEGSVRQSLALYRQAEKASPSRLGQLRVAGSLWNLGANLHAQGAKLRDPKKLRDAEARLRESLAIRNGQGLPPNDHSVLLTMKTLSLVLNDLKEPDKAFQLRRAIWEARRDHDGPLAPKTLESLRAYTGMIQDRAPFRELEPLLRESIELHRRAYGESDSRTLSVVRRLARKLDHAARFVEALELRHDVLNQIRRQYGENHHATAVCYNNLGITLSYQNKNAEAARFFQRSMEIDKRLGHGGTLSMGTTMQNLAGALAGMGRLEEAIANARAAVKIHEARASEPYSNVTLTRNSLAVLLSRNGQAEEAAAIHQDLLKIWRETGGPYEIAMQNLAATKIAMHDFAGAEPLLTQLLAEQAARGGKPSHGAALSRRHQLALVHYLQGHREQAIKLLKESESHYEELRRNWALTGLDRAIAGQPIPALALAAILAEQGRRVEAWRKWESTRARGLLDEFAFRKQQDLAPEERARRARLLAEIRATENKLAVTQSDARHVKALETRLSELQRQRFGIEKQLLAQASNMQMVTLEALQAELPEDGALIGWLDPFPTHAQGVSDNHWGVVVRKVGVPHWVKLPGSRAGLWTTADRKLRKDVATQLGTVTRTSARPRSESLRSLAALRLDPLKPYLDAVGDLPPVKQLIVVPSKALQGVSIQALDDSYSVSYAPSATVYVWLATRRRLREHSSAPSMLALADPIFSSGRAPAASPAPSTPPVGLVIANVSPKTPANVGIRPGDILVEYGGNKIDSSSSFQRANKSIKPNSEIQLAYWRGGELHRSTLRNALDVTFSPLTPAEVERFENDVSQVLRSGGDEALPELPGTRREVSALQRELQRCNGSAQLLIGEEANEATLRALNEQTQLAKFRYVHLATHGIIDAQEPLRSALIVSRNPESPQVDDARLTAGEILSTWKLNADLVTLSACQTALGRYAEGEGHIGFAQSLLLAGADSVLLSLWKVDDAATALLMRRFYQNVLGTRAELAGPMPKHAALHEAQLWLRGLEQKDAATLVKGLPKLDRGTRVRRDRQPVLKLPVQATARPYADPFYWSGFILVGHSD